MKRNIALLFLLLLFGSARTVFATASLLQTFNDPTVTSDNDFGLSVALDGNYVLIGAQRDDTNGLLVGQAHLFDAITGNLLQTFDDPTVTQRDVFATSVALDGNYVLIGASGDDTNGQGVGQAHLFDASTGSLLHTFNDPTVTSFDSFGSSVAIDGNNVLIGASGDDTNGQDVGQAHLFDASTGNLLQTFSDPTVTSFDNFGWSVALDGNHVLIGAPFDDTSRIDVGQAHLFDASTGNLLQTFNDPSVSSGGDWFGHSVALDGNHILIGAFQDNTIDISVGQAHLFDASTGNLLHTFNDPTVTGGDFFGFSVALDGNHVLIGAMNDGTKGQGVGQAHLFDASTGNLLQTFDDPTVTATDSFGSSVALDGNHVLIGAYGDDTNGTDVGQAHLFEYSSVVVPGDFNRDGTVTAQDYSTWSNAYGTSVTPGSGADGNGDGMIDAADYTVWRDAFEPIAPTSANSTSVPEPLSLSLIIGLALGMLATPRRS